jgi:hypothetical protein
MIYKYCNIKAAINISRNDFLKFSLPNEFNDPYDSCISIKPYSINDFFRLYNTRNKINNLYYNYKYSGLYTDRDDFLKKIKTKKFQAIILNHEKIYVQSWMDNAQNKISELLAITCFSFNPESILMWAHYAEKYKGCVLGFDYDECPEYKKYLFNVRYKKKPLSIDVKYCYGYKNIRTMINILRIKYTDWSYEQENRLIIPIPHLEKLIFDGKSFLGLTNCKNHIKQIIIGNRCIDDELIRSLRCLSNEYNIPVKYGRLSSNEDKVKIMDSIEN